MAAAQVAKKLKDKRQKKTIEGIFNKVVLNSKFLIFPELHTFIISKCLPGLYFRSPLCCILLILDHSQLKLCAKNGNFVFFAGFTLNLSIHNSKLYAYDKKNMHP